MLVLTRKEGEQIRIGDDIVITVVRTGNDKIRIGIQAPSDMLVLRSELQSIKTTTGKQEKPISLEAASTFSGIEIAHTA